MFRISTATEHEVITITVDGQLAGEYVDAVEACSQQAMGQGKPVHLFLRDVSHIDERGRAVLARLAAKGVRLTAHGLYTSYVVAEISREQSKRSHRRGDVAEPRAEKSAPAPAGDAAFHKASNKTGEIPLGRQMHVPPLEGL